MEEKEAVQSPLSSSDIDMIPGVKIADAEETTEVIKEGGGATSSAAEAGGILGHGRSNRTITNVTIAPERLGRLVPPDGQGLQEWLTHSSSTRPCWIAPTLE